MQIYGVLFLFLFYVCSNVLILFDDLFYLCYLIKFVNLTGQFFVTGLQECFSFWNVSPGSIFLFLPKKKKKNPWNIFKHLATCFDIKLYFYSKLKRKNESSDLLMLIARLVHWLVIGFSFDWWSVKDYTLIKPSSFEIKNVDRREMVQHWFPAF